MLSGGFPGANDAGVSRPQRLEALRHSLCQAGVKAAHEVIAGVGHDPWPIMARAKPFLAHQLGLWRHEKGEG